MIEEWDQVCCLSSFLSDPIAWRSFPRSSNLWPLEDGFLKYFGIRHLPNYFCLIILILPDKFMWKLLDLEYSSFWCISEHISILKTVSGLSYNLGNKCYSVRKTTTSKQVFVYIQSFLHEIHLCLFNSHLVDDPVSKNNDSFVSSVNSKGWWRGGGRDLGWGEEESSALNFCLPHFLTQ